MSRPLVENGRPRLGWLDEPVSCVNFMDASLRSPMGHRRSRLFRRQAFNQFQFVGITGPDWVLGAALVDLFWVGNAFVYALPLTGGNKTEHSWLAPGAAGIDLPRTPDTGQSVGCAPGREIRITFRDNELMLQVRTPRIRGEVSIGLEGVPLRVCAPAGYDGWTYTQKRNGLPVSGHLSVDGQSLDLDPRAWRAGLDWSGGFMRRETVWQWASINGVLESGQAFGLNLATGMNESGTTENACWVDGQIQRLPPVLFYFDRDDLMRPWQVRSEDGRVELTFEPRGARHERVDALLLASNFTQMGGFWSGRLVLDDGRTLEFGPLSGFAEDHYARW